MLSELYIDSININDKKHEQSYIFDLLVVKNLQKMDELKFNKRVTFIVGENGTGKSTLLEAIAVAAGFNAEGGTRNFAFSTNETHSSLYEYITVTRGFKAPKDGFFLRAESFYNVATEVDRINSIPTSKPKLIDYYGGKSLHKQSHGESFMSLILNRFGGDGLYILDEPEAALSPSRQMSLLAQIKQLENKNSQFIIATHAPILLAYPDADIYVLNENSIELTPYQKTEHYILTKQFLDNPERMIRYLLD